MLEDYYCDLRNDEARIQKYCYWQKKAGGLFLITRASPVLELAKLSLSQFH